jgi:hypothetical protein
MSTTYERVMTAYHEAGHITVAFAANLAIGGAVLWKTPERWMGLTGAFEKHKLPRKIKVSYHFSGMIAEQIASKLETNEGIRLTIGVLPDDQKQRLPKEHAVQDLEKIETLIGSDFWGTKKDKELRSYTEKLLRKYWPMVMMVAAKLLASGIVESKDLQRIIILSGIKVRPKT